MTRPEDELAVRIEPEVRDALTFQRYGPAPSIEEVRKIPLAKHQSENGWFLELFQTGADGVRPVGDEPGWPLRQMSAAWADPGRINAFHIHPKKGQNEYWTVIRGKLLVVLVDCRETSPTKGVRMRLVLAGDSPARLTIPAGVAHGYRAGTEGGLLVYGSDREFDPVDPDEGRLPWNHFGEALWEEDRG